MAVTTYDYGMAVAVNQAAEITGLLRIPTIGIGAGTGCDGQIQAIHELVGLYTDHVPKHAARYAAVHLDIRAAVERYSEEVRNRAFQTDAVPAPTEHSV